MKRLLLAMMVLGSARVLTAQIETLSLGPRFYPADTLSVTDIRLPFFCFVDGIVVLEAAITETGELEEVEVRRDFPCLTPLALQAVEEWKFSPATFAGEVIASRMPVVVTFVPPGAVVTPATLPELKAQTDAAIQAEFQPAEVIHAAFPGYPYNTVAFGAVVLEVTLSEKGEAEGVRVLRAITPLTVEAEAVLGKWRFMPATFNGRPVRSRIVLAFVFSPIYVPSNSRVSSSNPRGRR